MRSFAFAALLFLAGCPNPPNPPPPWDGGMPEGATSPCVAACNVLNALGCPEGKADDCTTTMARLDGERMVRSVSGAPMTCAAVAAAKTAYEAHNLGVPCAQ